MASLNHAKIIKGFENLLTIKDPAEFFAAFLKTFKFPAATIRNVLDPKNSRNIAFADGDFGIAKQVYFRAAAPGADMEAAAKEIKEHPVFTKHKVRFVMVTDFDSVVAYDAKVDDWTDFAFSDLVENYEFFLPLSGLYEKPLAYATHPADVKACLKMGKLYDVIKTQNHYDDSNLHELNVFLTRLLFCFFAEDTGIFPAIGQMTKAIASLTKADGSDLSAFFKRFFEVLDTPYTDPRRDNLPKTFEAFPYVNGGLFSEKCRIPALNARARDILLECGRLQWSEISPVIFGSMFQTVMNPETRHEAGAHYTSEKNIMKVIGPLFLDDLRAELNSILATNANRKTKLKEFQRKIAGLTFLDPACGSGNFLVVAYRELKKLELEAVKALKAKSVERSVFDDWRSEFSLVSIKQFYGIEIEEFPVEIARVSMWLMEHVMNREFGDFFGQVFPSIPLRDSAHITCANALTTDWETVVPAEKLSFIMGNPPFGGASTMTKEQKNLVLTIFKGVKSAGSLDLVAAWYKKACDICQQNSSVECAFVSTNSICQGEQVAPLWGTLFNAGIQINFAHQTFQWRNEAKDNAGVYCVIIGFSKLGRKNKKLFRYETVKAEPSSQTVTSINGYLVEGVADVMVTSVSRAINNAKPMVYGNKPTDGGNLIIEASDYEKFANEPAVRPYLKKLIGAQELLHSNKRFCLWLTKLSLEEALAIPLVRERVLQCKKFRLGEKTSTIAKANAVRPHLFIQRTQPEDCSTYLVIPSTTSERRNYIPMGFISNDTIVTNLCHLVPDGTLYDFAILESRMHMTWMRTVCGRLESRYRYSRDLCYNTFPWPEVSESQKQTLEVLAQNVLDARDFYPELTLADLYDPDKMPPELKEAHENLDLAVDQLYRAQPFASDEERLSMLFDRYEKLVAKSAPKNASTKRSRRK